MRLVILCAVLSGCCIPANFSEETCPQGKQMKTKYLLYDVNSGEGFNLRRDVYLRVANLVRKLNEKEPWTLVLPPWGALYHWKRTPHKKYFPWKTFFNLPSLNGWVKVIELEEYKKEIGSRIDSCFLLQNFDEGWDDKWEEKYEVKPCNNYHKYRKSGDSWEAFRWGDYISISNFSCVSFQGHASRSIPLIKKDKHSRSVLLDRAETLLHDSYGDSSYWSGRRSMRFSKTLEHESYSFISQFMELSIEDVTPERTPDWRDFKPKRGRKGLPFMSAHLRRRDFIRARSDEVPSIESAAKQLKELLSKWNLKVLFVASDAPPNEIDELRRYLHSFRVIQYTPDQEFIESFGDGGYAIIDQIICSMSRYFVGTTESTFSFRIQEEREILGFDPELTFNRLCGSASECHPPTKWLITY